MGARWGVLARHSPPWPTDRLTVIRDGNATRELLKGEAERKYCTLLWQLARSWMVERLD